MWNLIEELPFQLRCLGMHPNCHFPLLASVGNINPDKKDINGHRKSHLVGENASPAAEMPAKY